MTSLRHTAANLRTLADAYATQAAHAAGWHEEQAWLHLAETMLDAAQRAEAAAEYEDERAGLRLPLHREPAHV